MCYDHDVLKSCPAFEFQYKIRGYELKSCKKEKGHNNVITLSGYLTKRFMLLWLCLKLLVAAFFMKLQKL